MDRQRLSAIVYWASVVGIIGIILFAPRGCAKSEGKVDFGASGKPRALIAADANILSERLAVLPLEMFSESFAKEDWSFVVFYNYAIRADLGEAPLREAISLTIDMPGKITTSNADRIVEGSAVWALALGDSYKLHVKSYYVRWWLIIALVAFLIIVAFFHIRQRFQKTNKEES